MGLTLILQSVDKLDCSRKQLLFFIYGLYFSTVATSETKVQKCLKPNHLLKKKLCFFLFVIRLMVTASCQCSKVLVAKKNYLLLFFVVQAM